MKHPVLLVNWGGLRVRIEMRFVNQRSGREPARASLCVHTFALTFTLPPNGFAGSQVHLGDLMLFVLG